ncbi:MAG TPA: enoyl-CoA hydratase [Vicinamibacterales bacterium]|nr:enoyl-CoA hydratase [Vicinamibacterales bacterium]
MSTASTRFTIDGAVASFAFTRPETRNALTWEMYDALVAACDRVDADHDIRVFVLKGHRTAFASGTDISQFSGWSTRDDALGYEKRLDAVIDRVEAVAVATIAQVEGVAAGGGCAIAMACDLRVCTPHARFGVPVARTLGNCLSATNYTRLLELVGPALCKDLMFTGRLLDAAEAQRAGLVSRLVDADGVDAAVAELAGTVARNAPLTIRATKEAVRRILRSQRLNRDAFDDLVAACYTSEDFRNAVASFLAKQPAVFKGR